MALFDIILVYKSSLIIVGDFNIRVDFILDPHGTHFRDLMELFNLCTHVQQLINNCCHTLDLIITRAKTHVTELY